MLQSWWYVGKACKRSLGHQKPAGLSDSPETQFRTSLATVVLHLKIFQQVIVASRKIVALHEGQGLRSGFEPFLSTDIGRSIPDQVLPLIHKQSAIP
jgi:hypothetical protein